ncbi:MAG: hypothetical protein ACI84C_002726 [Flavobacteriales bacterium]|jgi:hypothetical protein
MNIIFKTTARLAFGLVIISSVLTSCKKDEEVADCTPDPAQTVSFHFDHMFAGETFGLDSPYNFDGVDVKFQRVSYFMSNFMLMDDDGGSQMMDGEVMMISAAESHSGNIGVTDLDHVHMMSFILGLDSITNHLDPITAEAPLNDPAMHWNWNPTGGYKFIRVDGERDITGDGNFESFEIHVATDVMKRAISGMMVHENVAADGLTIHMSVDYNKFFENIDFSTETLEGTHGAGAITTLVADGAATAFAIE